MSVNPVRDTLSVTCTYMQTAGRPQFLELMARSGFGWVSKTSPYRYVSSGAGFVKTTLPGIRGQARPGGKTRVLMVAGKRVPPGSSEGQVVVCLRRAG